MTTRISEDEPGHVAGNTARDGNIAIREEFDAAAVANTAAAWRLFLARHPGHPLADQAAERLQRLSGTNTGPEQGER